MEQREGGYWVAGTRVSLDSIVHAFRRGASPETIKRTFPLLTLEEVYGALTYYLGNQEQIDAYLAESEAGFEAEAGGRRTNFANENPDLALRLKSAEILSK